MKSFKEAVEAKFQRAKKTDTLYTGQINGKTYVVPHAFEGEGKTTPMRYSHVVSPVHVQHNNPGLTPEEIARVNQHIKAIHGGQNMVNESRPARPMRGDVFSHHQTLVAKKTLRMPDAMVGVMGGQTKEEARQHLAKMGWTKKQIHDHEHAQFVTEDAMIQEHVWSVTDHMGHVHEVQAKDSSEAKKKVVSVGGVHPQGIPMSQWHKVKVERKNLEEEKKFIQKAIKHPGALHKQLGVPAGEKIPSKKLEAAAKKGGKLGRRARFAKVLKSLHERTLTPSETSKKEEIVHKLKPKLQDFKSRYGAEKGKSVMYAVATKQAKKLAETMSPEKDYKIHEKGKVVPFGRKGDFTVKDAPKHLGKKMAEEAEQLDEISVGLAQRVHDKRNAQGDALVAKAANPQYPTQKRALIKKAAEKFKKADISFHHIMKNVFHDAPQFKKPLEEQISEAVKKPASEAEVHRKARKEQQERMKKYTHKTGDGKKHTSVESAKSHAEAVHKKTGNVISVEQLNELKIPKFGFLAKHLLGSDPRKIVKDVHGMSHHDLAFHHKNRTENPPKNSPREFQQRAVAKELKRRGDAEGTHKPLDRSKFVKEEHSKTFTTVKDVLNEVFTRKHFRQVADIIKAHPDEKKRAELAAHHTEIFAKSNPRFDKKRFYQAANVPLQEGK